MRVVPNKDAFDGLGVKGVPLSCVDTLDVRCAEEGDEFAVVWLEVVCFEEGGGDGVVGCFDGEIVGDLDCVFNCEVPEGRWKEVFGEKVAGDIDDVPPVAFE